MLGSNFVDQCTFLLKDTGPQHTPLQREEFQKLVDANARGDEEQVKQLSEQINQHYSKLNKNLSASVIDFWCRRTLGYRILQCIAHDYAPPGSTGTRQIDWLALCYGDVEHQLQVIQMVKSNRFDEPEISLEMVDSAKERWEGVVFGELCLDPDYARKRFRAYCKDDNLINGLLHASDWDGMKVLLDQDEEVSKKLIPWLSRLETPSHPFLEPVNQIVTSQIQYYRAIAEDRPSTVEPPPAYTVKDLNAPPDYPEPPSGWMSLMGLDQVMNRLRSTFNDPGTE